MASSSTEAHTTEINNKGAWIGIDLGTSNSTAAAWDLSRSRCKVLRLGHKNLARPPGADGGGGNRKEGKIVPSAVLFSEDEGGDHTSDVSDQIISRAYSLVGYAAIQSFRENNDKEKPNEQSCSRALVTSFKRVVGMTPIQANELKNADPEFWNSLPFRSVIMDMNRDVENEEHRQLKQLPKERRGHSDKESSDVVGNPKTNITFSESTNDPHANHDGTIEGVAICVKPLKRAHPSSNRTHKPSEYLVTPLQVSAILLQSVRVASSEYLKNNRKNIQAPGFEDVSQAHNCIIGVPAHYSQAQRTAIVNAAKNAGFTGHVGVMTESTAAAMAYGLFVSPQTIPASFSSPPNNISGGKNVLVFDMGGGSTDVTIARIDFGTVDDKVQFRVIATAGDRCLGGDNVDELLARHLWRQQVNKPATGADWKASEHQELISQCRRAKEELCGNINGTSPVKAMAETHVTLFGKTFRITSQEFDATIQPLVDRAECIVDNALSALVSQHCSNLIHEVVLVGGSTHIPTIRSMIRRKFPPPIPPELCTSISAETSVAQGLAIQAALVSGAVPMWELRNAMMLDVLPHSVGVWVRDVDSNNDEDAGKAAAFRKGKILKPNNNGKHCGRFVPILDKDSPLPAMGSATFTLAAKYQSGVTVIAAEHIGPGDVYQCMGVFDFLLHRIEKCKCCDDLTRREVKVGMTLETNGKFTVSVFDENDPEHLEKRQRFLKEKALHQGNNGYDILEEDRWSYGEKENRPVCSGTEIGLLLFCTIFFALYVAARIAFSDVEVPHMSDEM